MLYDLIIIGGGPAGITAGIYSARKYIKTLLLTKDFEGQIFTSAKVENYPGFEEISGSELSTKLKNHLLKFRKIIEIKEGMTVERIEKIKERYQVITSENKKYSSFSLIIATGASPRRLKIKGTEEFEGKGISFCEICDGIFFKDKTVAVVGSGNAGLEASEELLKFVKKLYLIEREDEIIGDKLLFKKVVKNGAKVILSAELKEIVGKNFVEKLIYFDKKEKKEKELILDGIFIKIGQEPNTKFLKGFLKLNRKGEIVVNPKTLETSREGIFAAGDVTDIFYKQYVISAGDGARAALSAYNYLKTIKKIK